MRIHSLHYYPVKSAAPVTVNRLSLETEGPLFDREWMVVDEAGKFVTQRELPSLALLRATVSEDLTLDFKGKKLHLPLHRSAPQKTVQVWADTVEAELENAGEWLKAAFGRPLELVRLGAGGRKTGKERSVRFPDAYPLHLCTLESLSDLNRRLPEPVEILRFRPNLVLAGSPAFAEDSWAGIRIGPWEFPIGKACARCTITTVDLGTGKKGQEPLKTLSTYRKKGTKVEFGQYLLSVAGAELEVGMEVFPL